MMSVGDFLPTQDSVVGSVEIREIFEYYDAPLLFSAEGERGSFIAYAADYSDTGTTYLYAPLSERRLRQVTSGRLPVRSAFFETASGTVFAVTVPHTTEDVAPGVVEILAQEIPNDWLPDVELRVNTSPDVPADVETFSQEELTASAVRQGRHLLALELSSPSTERSDEIRLRDAGPLMVEFQAMADTMSPHSDFALQALQTASVVVVLDRKSVV